jgi:hypothetical protein
MRSEKRRPRLQTIWYAAFLQGCARKDWLVNQPDAVLAGVDGELPAIPDAFSAHRTRNNQLLLAALAQIQPKVEDAIAQYGRERVGVVLGTSTSGLNEGDEHVNLRLNNEPSLHWQYPQQELGDPSRFLSHWLALEGPAYTLSTACSSSACHYQRSPPDRGRSGRCRYRWRFRYAEPHAGQRFQ